MDYENLQIWDAMKSAKYRQSIEDLKTLISTASDLDVAINDSLALVCKALHAQVGTFWVYNDHDDGLIRAKARYGGTNLDDIRLLPGEGIAGQVIEKCASTIIADCQKDERWAGRIDKETGFVTNSMICSPLSYKGASFACIQIINKIDDTLYDQKDLSFIDELTKIIVDCLVKRNMITGFMRGLSIEQQSNFGLGKNVNGTTMFVEIIGFNVLFNDIGLSKTIAVLNAFLIYVTTIIEKHGGFVDKYMGDKVMAIWGIDSEQKDMELEAVKAAIQIVKNKSELTEKIKNSFGVELNFKIAINCGTVYYGVIGNRELADYTVIGESVNICHKMLKMSLSNDILVTQDLIMKIGNKSIKFTTLKDRLEYNDGRASLTVFRVLSLL